MGFGYAVIADKDEFQFVVDARVLVDQRGEVVDEADAVVGKIVAWGGLAGEQFDDVRPVFAGIGENILIERDGMDEVEELTFVGMEPLDVAVDQGVIGD